MGWQRPGSTEFDLLIAASARPPTLRHRAVLANLGTHTRLDWDIFLRMVERHRVAPLVLDGLASAGVSLPEEIARTLRDWAMRDKLTSLRASGILLTLLPRLEAANIPVATIKGPSLAVLAFGDLSLRQSKDLDILIAPRDIHAALEVLIASDCQVVVPDSFGGPGELAAWSWMVKDMSLVHRPSGILIELHWRLNHNPHLMPFPVLGRRSIPLGQTAVDTLDDDDLLLYLAVHGAKHYWFRLKWLADVYSLLSMRSPDDIVDFHRRALDQGLHVPVEQMLFLVEETYGPEVPQAIRTLALSSRRTRFLTREADGYLHSLEEPESGRFETTKMALGRFLLRTGLRYWLRELTELLVDMTYVTSARARLWTYPVAILGRPVFWIRRKIGREQV